MDSRSKGLLATLAAVVLCGCPGLFMCVFGALVAAGAPVNTELNGVSSSTQLPASVGVALLCLAVIFILIPVVVAFFTLRTKKTAAPPVPSEPIPPAS